MTTDSSIQRLATVYEAMRRNSEGNPLLASYHDFDTIRDNIIVLHGTENERDYLVYNDQHPKAGQEVHFDIAGYICSFNLPGNSVTTRWAMGDYGGWQRVEHCKSRLFHRPHSLKQRVTLVAYSSDEFQRSLEGLASLAAYLNQYAIDGNAMPPKERNAFGMPAIAAETNLFTYRQLEMEFEEMDFPSNLDPSGRIMAEVRRRSFCYTTDNAVEYSEIALDRPDWWVEECHTNTNAAHWWPHSLQGNICLSEKFAVEPGVFRHGQLVTMSVAIRSARRKADPRFPNVTRGVDIRIKGLTLVDREVEMVGRLSFQMWSTNLIVTCLHRAWWNYVKRMNDNVYRTTQTRSNIPANRLSNRSQNSLVVRSLSGIEWSQWL